MGQWEGEKEKTRSTAPAALGWGWGLLVGTGFLPEPLFTLSSGIPSFSVLSKSCLPHSPQVVGLLVQIPSPSGVMGMLYLPRPP